MPIDSIGSYQGSGSAGGGYFLQPEKGPPKKKRIDPFTKDVIEAMEDGDLEKALQKLRALEGRDESQTEELTFLFKLLKRFGFQFLISKSRNKGIKRTSQRDDKILSQKTNLADVTRIQTIKSFLQTLSQMVLTLFRKMGEGANLGFEKSGQFLGFLKNSSTNILQKFLNPFSHVIDPLKKYLEKLNSLKEKFSDKLRLTFEKWSEKLAERSRLAIDVLRKKLTDLSDPLKALYREKIIPKFNDLQNKIREQIELQTQRLTHGVERVMQLTQTVLTPVGASLQQLFAQGQQAGTYGVKHLQRALKKVSESALKIAKWIGDRAESSFQKFFTLMKPFVRKAGKILVEMIQTATSSIFNLLARFIRWVKEASIVVFKKTLTFLIQAPRLLRSFLAMLWKGFLNIVPLLIRLLKWIDRFLYWLFRSIAGV